MLYLLSADRVTYVLNTRLYTVKGQTMLKLTWIEIVRM
jgi:hypothetical protein